MKLSQYKEKKNSKKIIIIIGAILLFAGGIIIEKTFANFKVQKSFKVMEGNFIYEGSGDVIFAFYKDNQEVTSIPTLEEGYVYEKSECNNKASIEWNSGKWAPLVTNLTTSKTKCDIYFKKGSGSGLYNALENLIDKKEGQLIYDGTDDNNLRFIGADPDNYVIFNNNEYIWRGYYSSSSSSYKEYNSYEECTSAKSYNSKCEKFPAWRIIGVMNNVEDEFGNTGSHLKIIRDSIGEYSWDSSESSVNSGYGVNEWSVSDIQKVLNENYYNKKAGGTCYNEARNTVATCPKWESIGLNDNARAMVSKVKWNLGTMQSHNKVDYMTPIYSYINERSENSGNICNYGESQCNFYYTNNLTTWIGYIGLMYPSDFGFSTSGGGESQRQTCLNTTMFNIDTGITGGWASYELSYCYSNSWINKNYNGFWTMTPYPWSGGSNYGIGCNYGALAVVNNYAPYLIRPTLYLNSNIKIEEDNSENYGSKDNPYRLSYIS